MTLHVHRNWNSSSVSSLDTECSQANATTSSKDSQPQTNASNVIILFSTMHFRLVICIITGHCSAHKQMQLQAQRKVNLRQMPRMSSSSLVQCALQARHLYHHWTVVVLCWNKTLLDSASDNGLPLNHHGVWCFALQFITVNDYHHWTYKQRQITKIQLIELIKQIFSSAFLFSSICTSGSSTVSLPDCCGVVLNQTLLDSVSDNGLPLNHHGV